MTTTNGLGEQQAKRVAKAINESGEWVWTKTPYGSWVVTTPGGTYEVNENVCMCPDHKHNCSGTEMRCKHVIGLRHKLLAEGAPEPARRPKGSGLPMMTDAEVRHFDALFA